MVILSALQKAENPEQFCFFIIDGGIKDKNKEIIGSIVNKYAGTLLWVVPDNGNYNDLPVKRYGLAAYYRLSLATLLPGSIDRVIYLDSDMLVAADLAELWRTSLSGAVIGAVENLGVPPKSLNLPQNEYFNSGTLLIDLKQWREDDYESQLFSLFEKKGSELQFPDQDALNLIFEKQWKRLPLRWNIQPATWAKYEKKKITNSGYSYDDYEEAIKNPGVIHFLAKSKPWFYSTLHPYKSVYITLFNESAWRYDIFSQVAIKEKFRKFFSVEKLIKNNKRKKYSAEVTFKN